MKRVLIFSLAYYPHVGGAEVAVKEITDRIGDIQFDMVTLRFSSSDAVEEQVGNVHVYRVSTFGGGYLGKVLYPLSAAMLAVRLYRTNRYDGFWAMMGYMVFPIVLMRLAGIRVPYAITLQEGDTFEHVFRRLHILPVLPLMRYGFRHATVVQTISIFLARWAKSAGYPREPIVIPNGYDSTVWFSVVSQTPQNKEVFWKNQYPALKLKSKKILITTSRLVHKNAIDDVIRALKLLPENVHFVILGKGEKEKELRDLSISLGVSDRTHFLGEVPNTKIAYRLTASDIFIRPSRSEGMGNSFIEAMAAGLPVIATQEGGIADFLFDAKRNPEKDATGWAVDKNSPEQIVEAVKYILTHPDEVKRVVDTAKKMVIVKYDWDLIAKDMKNKVFAVLL